jgi:chromatin segregation and condensation protein Rec8/ScpA/Scc1 (kleisin family)
MGAGKHFSPPARPPRGTPRPAPPRAEASLFDLINAVTEVLKRVGKREDLREIFEDKWSVSEKIEFLIKLTAEKGSVKFSELFSGATSRTEVVCTFPGAAGIDPAQATGLRASGRFWGN